MAVVPIANSLIDENDSAVKLADYAQELGLSEDQFFGLNNPDTLIDSCNPIWTLPERKRIARYLREAQTEIENVVGFPLAPRWFTDEWHYYGYPVHTRWAKVIAAGFRNESAIATGVTLTWTTDPVMITRATSVTNEDEVRVVHPGTDIEIVPSSVTIANGYVTIEVPWARLVKLAKQDNPSVGWDYSDVPPSATSPYVTTVDIYRVYNDEAIQGGLIWRHRGDSDTCTCDCVWCQSSCNDYIETACISIRNADTGALELLPVHFGTEWTVNCSTCYCATPDAVYVNYRAGLLPTDPLAQVMKTAIIRLAHSKMPKPPCGCDVANEYWSRDRNVPTSLSIEQAACPFGQSDGAYWAWKQALAARYQCGLAL